MTVFAALARTCLGCLLDNVDATKANLTVLMAMTKNKLEIASTRNTVCQAIQWQNSWRNIGARKKNLFQYDPYERTRNENQIP